MIRINTTIPFPPALVFEGLYDIGKRQEWDKDQVKNPTLIDEDEDTCTSVAFWEVNTPPMVSNREQLVARKYKKDFPTTGCIMVHASSTTHPDYPEGTNPLGATSNIRVNNKITGTLLEPNSSGGTTIKNVMQVDLRGNIPKAIINSKIGEVAKNFPKTLGAWCATQK